MIALVFALEFESACFQARHNPQLRVATWLLGAMGENAARSLADKLSKTRPSLVISAGFAGGLQSDLAVGSLLLGENYSDARLITALRLSSRWHVGRLHTATAIVERAEDKLQLGRETGALAADLETAHLARVCAESHIPMLSVRCISDSVNDDMPVPAAVLMNPKTGRPEPLQLFRHLIANPKSVPAFNQLLKNAKHAQSELASGLEEILPQLLQAV